MLDHDEDIQNVEECCRNREEVDGNQLFRVVLQECPPALRWRLWMPDHVFANGRFRNLDSQLEKFAMDSRCSPAHIISTQSPNEVARFSRDSWPTWLSMANLPGPVPTETAAVPIDHGIRFHDPECLTLSGRELRQTDRETSIYGFQFPFGRLSLKHNDLVSQCEDLDLEIGPTLEIQRKGSQERKQHREHGG